MEIVEIDKYQVSIRDRADARDGRPRPSLSLMGRDGSMATEVFIHFESRNSDMINGGYTGLRFGVRDERQKFKVVMNPDAFDTTYGILRNETPTFFLYEIKDVPSNPSSDTKLITVVQIGTQFEPTGEGPIDEDA